MTVLNLESYNVFSASKPFGKGLGGGITVCNSNRYFKIHLAIKVSAPMSYNGLYIKLIHFVMQHLVADIQNFSRLSAVPTGLF
jgi:hypothetical protein